MTRPSQLASNTKRIRCRSDRLRHDTDPHLLALTPLPLRLSEAPRSPGDGVTPTWSCAPLVPGCPPISSWSVVL